MSFMYVCMFVTSSLELQAYMQCRLSTEILSLFGQAIGIKARKVQIQISYKASQYRVKLNQNVAMPTSSRSRTHHSRSRSPDRPDAKALASAGTLWQLHRQDLTNARVGQPSSFAQNVAAEHGRPLGAALDIVTSSIMQVERSSGDAQC